MFLGLFVIVERFLSSEVFAARQAVAGRLLDLARKRLHLGLVTRHPTLKVVQGHRVQLGNLALQVVPAKRNLTFETFETCAQIGIRSKKLL